MLPTVSLETFEAVTRQYRLGRRQFVQRVVDSICEENEILGLLLQQRAGEGIDLFGFCVAYESMRLQAVSDLRAKRGAVEDRAKTLVSAIEAKIIGPQPSLMAKAIIARARPELTSALTEELLAELPEPPEEAPSVAPLLILPRSSGV